MILYCLLSSCFLMACSAPNSNKTTDTESQKDESTENSTAVEKEKDIAEIEKLVRNAYVWLNNGNPLRLGMIADETESKYIGYQLSDLTNASSKLKKTDYFTEKFIGDFNRIHTLIHKGLGNGNLVWETESMPEFGTGADPWCNCQDVPFDEPNPWSLLDIETIKLSANEGEFNWKWGNLEPNAGSGWNSFRYHFTVKKVGDKWKIDSLEGIDAKYMAE